MHIITYGITAEALGLASRKIGLHSHSGFARGAKYSKRQSVRRRVLLRILASKLVRLERPLRADLNNLISKVHNRGIVSWLMLLLITWLRSSTVTRRN
jgi:hypothetical protein